MTICPASVSFIALFITFLKAWIILSLSIVTCRSTTEILETNFTLSSLRCACRVICAYFEISLRISPRLQFCIWYDSAPLSILVTSRISSVSSFNLFASFNITSHDCSDVPTFPLLPSPAMSNIVWIGVRSSCAAILTNSSCNPAAFLTFSLASWSSFLALYNSVSLIITLLLPINMPFS